jgi:F0F1-type ATP synthase assembly protein I
LTLAQTGYRGFMPSIKKSLARKAVKSTAKHTAHGTASKLKRDPARAATLLGVGAAIGALLGWVLARTSGAAPVTGGSPA